MCSIDTLSIRRVARRTALRPHRRATSPFDDVRLPPASAGGSARSAPTRRRLSTSVRRVARPSAPPRAACRPAASSVDAAPPSALPAGRPAAGLCAPAPPRLRTPIARRPCPRALGVRARGFRARRRTHFDPRASSRYPPGKPLTVIVGANGCGKTTIIECLKVRRGGRREPLVAAPEPCGAGDCPARDEPAPRPAPPRPAATTPQFVTTGALPPGSASGQSFVHDPKVRRNYPRPLAPAVQSSGRRVH